jgi:hypothetical protein
MEATAHLLNQVWHQLRFLPISPLAQLVPPGDAPVLDGLLARAGVYRERTPALQDMDRLPQLRGYLALPGRGPASRFCDGTFRALYAGEGLPTCVAEMAYHHGRALADTREPAGAIRVFEGLALKVAGPFRDLRKGHADLHRPEDYGPAQAFGRDLKAQGEAGAVYRAVRRKGGECLALLLAAPVKACTLKQVLALRWDGERLA